MRQVIEQFVAWTKLKIRLHFSQKRVIYFKEREIWWGSLGMNVGYEQNGKHETFERPVLVVKKFNHDLLWVLPMTTSQREGKFHFPIEYNGQRSAVVLSQLRTISARRLLRKVRTLPYDEFHAIRESVRRFL